MPHADFVHLRVHSSYSLSEGAIKADKIAALALETAMPAVGIADTGNLFGAQQFELPGGQMPRRTAGCGSLTSSTPLGTRRSWSHRRSRHSGI